MPHTRVAVCCVVVLCFQGAVKQFFNEKEVTSTLMMDALYSGCRQLEEHSRQFLAVGERGDREMMASLFPA